MLGWLAVPLGVVVALALLALSPPPPAPKRRESDAAPPRRDAPPPDAREGAGAKPVVAVGAADGGERGVATGREAGGAEAESAGSRLAEALLAGVNMVEEEAKARRQLAADPSLASRPPLHVSVRGWLDAAFYVALLACLAAVLWYEWGVDAVAEVAKLFPREAATLADVWARIRADLALASK
jgi:hypothetical protein